MSFDLSPCQEKAAQVLRETRENIFLTGRAGSGKSFLISHFLKDKDRKYFPIVASTGAAAVLVGGRTFHSFFGLGVMEGGVEKTVERALENRRLTQRLRQIEGFILDEISMISGPTLRAAEAICRLARKKDEPWGGARVIAVGDFAQLPPVSVQNSQKEWAFLDGVWQRSCFKPLLLNTILRSQDQTYTGVLNDIREGIVSDKVEYYLNRKTNPDYELQQEVAKTHLFPRRDTAEDFNKKRLAQIKEPARDFPTLYMGEAKAVEQMKRQAPIPELLQLKESALVMLRVNDTQYRYVNGSLAYVIKMSDDVLTLQLKNGKEIEIEKNTFSLQGPDGYAVASATNFPVTLAYATTIHKAQGATLDEMVCDLRRLWEPGQAYVALSRLRSGEGLTLTGWDRGSIRVDQEVVKFHESLEEDR